MQPQMPATIQLVDGTVDLVSGRIERGERSIRLTTMERRLLQWMAARPRIDVSHDDLLQKVWEYAPGVSSRAPYFTVRRVRNKVEQDPETPRLIQTVHGVGFCFMPLDAPDPAPAVPIGNLPILPSGIIGRDPLLSELSAHLERRSRVHLFGPIGVGKTTLALALAHRSGRMGWFLSLPHAHELPAVLARLGSMCGHEPDKSDLAPAPDELGQTVQMLTAAGPEVLVVDKLAPQLTRPLLDALGPLDGQLQVISVHSMRV